MASIVRCVRIFAYLSLLVPLILVLGLSATSAEPKMGPIPVPPILIKSEMIPNSGIKAPSGSGSDAQGKSTTGTKNDNRMPTDDFGLIPMLLAGLLLFLFAIMGCILGYYIFQCSCINRPYMGSSPIPLDDKL